MQQAQQGFSLLELMVALSIGLVLVAVGVQLFWTSQVNYHVQHAASTVQDSGVFGLNAVTKNIRLANHGNAGAMNDQTRYGGIVLSAQHVDQDTTQLGNLNGLKIEGTAVEGNAYISQAAATPSALPSHASDQLVVIYQAPVDMRTCTGKVVRGPDRSLNTMTKGWYVIEKYYVKKNDDQSADLYCSDAFFIARGESTPQSLHKDDTETLTLTQTEQLQGDYGHNPGQMIAQHVEYMRVQLLVRYSDQHTATLDVAQYQQLDTTSATRPAIIGIQLGWLVRSSEPVANTTRREYQVLDQTLQVPDDKFMRHIYSTTIALRNGGLGDVIQ